jgi:hypothetical protein
MRDFDDPLPQFDVSVKGIVRRSCDDGVFSATRKRKKKASTMRSATSCRRCDCVVKNVVTIIRIVVLGSACCGSDGGSASLHLSKLDEMQRSRFCCPGDARRGSARFREAMNRAHQRSVSVICVPEACRLSPY